MITQTLFLLPLSAATNSRAFLCLLAASHVHLGLWVKKLNMATSEPEGVQQCPHKTNVQTLYHILYLLPLSQEVGGFRQ